MYCGSTSLLGLMVFPLEVFKEYSEVLLLELLLVFQDDALEGGILPKSMRHANIVGPFVGRFLQAYFSFTS